MTTTQHSPAFASWTAKIAEANDAIGAARDAFAGAFIGSKAWRDASDDLDWWIGREAFCEAARDGVR